MNVSQIDFNHYKQKLKEYLRSDNRFRDINFEASGINAILNLLAYNSHYLGSYMFMLNNESSIDTAQTAQSVYSKARGLGYTPRLKKSATVEVTVSRIEDTFPDKGYVVLHRGKEITGTVSRSSDSRKFVNMDDIFLYDYEKTIDNKWKFKSGRAVLTEGRLSSWEFRVNSSVRYQRFVIKDKSADVDSLRVFVKSSDADSGVRYDKAISVFDVKTDSPVYYTSVTRDGYLEVFFGANVFGRQPEDGKIIRCEYVSSSGELGNGAEAFSFPGFEITANEPSNSGSDGESIESTRFNAMTHFRSQNRLLTPDDYRSAVLSYFRNIQAINVWRGEEHFRKSYGKVYISIKPYYADRLSKSAKKIIEDRLLEDSKRLGAEPLFIDPEFIECDVDIVLDTDINKTSTTVKAVNDAAVAAAIEYNTSQLNVFGNSLSDVELNDKIRKSSKAINSSFTRKALRKQVGFRTDDTGTIAVFFGNPIIPGSVEFELVGQNYTFRCSDNNGIINGVTTNVRHPITREIGKVDYETGLVQFNLPDNNPGKGSTVVSCTPKNPDVKSSFNNIVRIARVRVVDE